MRILNIPDAVMVPGQPECPVLTLTQRVAITLLRLSTSLPILVSQEILPIGVSTKDNGPMSSMMTSIIIIIIIIIIIVVIIIVYFFFPLHGFVLNVCSTIYSQVHDALKFTGKEMVRH